MRRCSYSITLALLLLAALVSAVSADDIQDQPEVTSLYAKGQRLMREGNFFEAAKVFEELSGRYSDSPNLDLFVFNRAKADLYLAEYDKAVAGFDFFVTRFPKSPYVPYAQFFAGDALYLKGIVSRAVERYFAAYNAANSDRLTQLIEKSIVAAFDQAASINISAADFSTLTLGKRCKLIGLLAPALHAHQQDEVAEEVMSECGSSEAPSDGTPMSPGQEIACVLPYSGELQTFGDQLYNGAVIAAKQYKEQTGREMRLVKYDTHGDPVDAARISKELSESPRTLAIIGPLTSEAASVASASVSCGNLPLLSPTATKAGMTRLSSTSFQLSPNIELEGIVMADYAVDVLDADSAVVLAPTSDDDMRMARAFIERFKERRGKIVAIQYYRERDRDFGEYIRDVKQILLGLQRDSIYYVNERGDTLDPDGLPAYVDVLYMPGTPQQLRQLLPQVNFYNLNAQYLGSDGWGDELVYKLGDDVTKNAVFPSPFIIGSASIKRAEFASAYDTRFGGAPPRLAALGFDAGRLVADALATGASDRDAMTSYLSRVRGFEGAAGTITFGSNRENIELPLFRIVSEQAVPIETEMTHSNE
jgi:ABC-type branched-subunit amino acid transport system substrate-binding protein